MLLFKYVLIFRHSFSIYSYTRTCVFFKVSPFICTPSRIAVVYLERAHMRIWVCSVNTPFSGNLIWLRYSFMKWKVLKWYRKKTFSILFHSEWQFLYSKYFCLHFRLKNFFKYSYKQWILCRFFSSPVAGTATAFFRSSIGNFRSLKIVNDKWTSFIYTKTCVWSCIYLLRVRLWCFFSL